MLQLELPGIARVGEILAAQRFSTQLVQNGEWGWEGWGDACSTVLQHAAGPEWGMGMGLGGYRDGARE